MEADFVVEWARNRPRSTDALKEPVDIAVEWILRNAPIVEAAVRQEEASRELVLEYGKKLPEDVKVWIATTNATEQAVRAARGKA